MIPLARIISGGQTGVDQGALQGALDVGFPCGGWCPEGRICESGKIPAHFPVLETTSSVYPHRTRLNIKDSDGTVIISSGAPKGGTGLTISLAQKMGKPLFFIAFKDLPAHSTVLALEAWVNRGKIRIANVAGPREMEFPGSFMLVRDFFRLFLGGLKERGISDTPPEWPPKKPHTSIFSE